MKQKIELLRINEKWAKSAHKTQKELLECYPDITLITTTNEYYYFNSNHYKKLGNTGILYRVTRLPQMTKKEAEDKYDIKIQD